jgi:hypothetical protein
MDPQVRPLGAHVRAGAGACAQPIHQGVLDPQRPEPSVSDLGLDSVRVNGKGPFRRDVLLPRDIRGPGIEGLGALRNKAGERQQNPIRTGDQRRTR